jgi:hypothetical protein
MLLRAAATVASGLALAVPAASAHSGIPKAWWLEEGSAVTRLREALKPRYDASVLRTFRGSCNGLTPRATRSGRAVYKHFSCVARMRANGVTFTFAYRVHVSGPRGRISIGG